MSDASPETAATAASKTPAPVNLDSLVADEDADWENLPDIGEGVRVCVRPIDYPPYTIARSALFKRLSKTYQGEPIPDRVRVPALGKLYAEHLLTNWEGFNVPYSRDAALSRMSKWEWRRLTEQVEWASAKRAGVNAQQVEEALGNSDELSGTS